VQVVFGGLNPSGIQGGKNGKGSPFRGKGCFKRGRDGVIWFSQIKAGMVTIVNRLTLSSG